MDLKRGRIEVRHTMIEINGYLEELTPKTYEERLIPISKFMLEQLAEAIEGRSPSEHVFVGRRRADVLRNRVFRRHSLTEATDEIGLPVLVLTPNELRHTCMSLAVSADANVNALQGVLGHASARETLDTFADLFDSDLDSVAVALDDTVTRMGAVKTTRISAVKTQSEGQDHAVGQRLAGGRAVIRFRVVRADRLGRDRRDARAGRA